MSKTLSVRLFFVLLLSGIIIFLPGCAKSENSGEEPPVYSPARVLTPEAPGTLTLGSSPLVLDISNQDQGYLTAQSDSEDSRMSIQLTTPSGVLYSYFLAPKEQAVIPFSEGSGDYVITCYQQINGSQYAALYSETLTVNLENEFLPFLYPNQYVNFSAESEACTLAQSLVTEEMKDVDILKTFYNYVTSHITYDYDKANSVEAGYLPDIDETLRTGTGICFDYAAVMASMLRCERIPTRLEVGYMGDVYHAWISTYIKDKGWVNGIIEFDGNDWKLMDPTFASTSSDPKDFLTQTDEYITKYVY